MEENFNKKDNRETGFAREESVEKEQDPDEIIYVLEQSAEKREKVKITVRSMDGKFSKKMSVFVWNIEGDILWVVTEDGEGMPIELSRIEKVEQKKEQEPPPEELKI